MKKIEEMTEEEILNRAAVGIHDYLMHIRPHGDFVLDDCMSRQVNELNRLFNWSRGIRRSSERTLRDVRDLEQLVNELMPKMQEQARAVQLHYTREQTLWKIRGTSAEAQIKKAFLDVGMSTVVECQKYRAKVLIDLGVRKLRLYVGLKALEKQDTLPNLTRAVLDLKDAVCRIGGDIKLER